MIPKNALAITFFILDLKCKKFCRKALSSCGGLGVMVWPFDVIVQITEPKLQWIKDWLQILSSFVVSRSYQSRLLNSHEH